MNNNTKVDTAQKGQATNKKTSKVPTGKVTLMKDTEARKKAREEQYRNFRINSLRRRCKRMKFDEEKTEEFVKKLIEQMNAPKEYSILVMLDGCKGKYISNPDGEGELFKSAGEQFKEDLEKKNIKYKYYGSTYFSLDGDQDVLARIREIAPDGAKIYPYAKKMESVLPKAEPKKKKPTNNTAEKKTAAKSSKKISGGSYRYARKQKGRIKTLADIRRASRYVKRNLKKDEKIDVKKVFKVVEERKKGGAATTVQLNAKKGSKGPKKASTNVKKAA